MALYPCLHFQSFFSTPNLESLRLVSIYMPYLFMHPFFLSIHVLPLQGPFSPSGPATILSRQRWFLHPSCFGSDCAVSECSPIKVHRPGPLAHRHSLSIISLIHSQEISSGCSLNQYLVSCFLKMCKYMSVCMCVSANRCARESARKREQETFIANLLVLHCQLLSQTETCSTVTGYHTLPYACTLTHIHTWRILLTGAGSLWERGHRKSGTIEM